MSRFAVCSVCGRAIAAGVACPYCLAGSDRARPPAASVWRRSEEKAGFTGCPDRPPPSAWERFADRFGPTFRDQERARRLAAWRAKHLVPGGGPMLLGALRLRKRWGWGHWRGGVGWIDGEQLWWRRWLLPATVSLPRREIATVTVRPAGALEAIWMGPGRCIWTLTGPLWIADVALQPPDEGELNEWLLAGHLRPMRRAASRGA